MLKKLLLFIFIFGSTQVYSMDSEAPEFSVGNVSLEEIEHNKVTAINRYYCHICKEIIYDKSPKNFNLKFHLKNAHKICQDCNIKFETPEEITAHFLKKHNNK